MTETTFNFAGKRTAGADADKAVVVVVGQPHVADAGRRGPGAGGRPPVRGHRVREAGARRRAAQPELRVSAADRRHGFRRKGRNRQFKRCVFDSIIHEQASSKVRKDCSMKLI